MIDYINKHGGIAGHQVEGVWVTADGTNTDPSYPEQLCTSMTQDYKVFAVVDGNNESDSALQCYVDHKVMLFNEGLNEVGAQTIQGWAPYYWDASLPSLDRGMEEELAALNQGGFFSGSGHKVGYLYLDTPTTRLVLNERINPRLAQFGYSSPDTAGIAITDPSQEQSAIQSAALKFKTDGVDRVFFVNDVGAGFALYFMRGADSEKYVPRYGLQSADGLDATAYLEPAGQLAGAMAVGYLPWADTSTANSDGFPGSPAEAQCYKIMNDHGIATPNPPGRDSQHTAGMDQNCDGLLFLYYGAAQLGQNLNATNFAAAAERLGNSFQNTFGYAGNSFAGPRHHDLNDSYRLLHWDPSCTNGSDGGTGNGSTGCWKLNSRTSYRSPEV